VFDLKVKQVNFVANSLFHGSVKQAGEFKSAYTDHGTSMTVLENKLRVLDHPVYVDLYALTAHTAQNNASRCEG